MPFSFKLPCSLGIAYANLSDHADTLKKPLPALVQELCGRLHHNDGYYIAMPVAESHDGETWEIRLESYVKAIKACAPHTWEKHVDMPDTLMPTLNTLSHQFEADEAQIYMALLWMLHVVDFGELPIDRGTTLIGHAIVGKSPW